MKFIVRALIGLVILVVIVVVGAYIALSTYDREELKAIAQEQGSAATGRQLTIDGPLDFKLSLTPAITVEDVSFANADWGTRPDMASMKRFELEVAILPLLTGEIEINRIVLIEPDIFLETNAAGKGNWELDLPPAPEQPQQAEGGMQLSRINGMTIERGNVTYRDGVTGEESAFFIEKLNGGAPSAEVLVVDMRGNADGVPVVLDAQLKASGQTYAIENADIEYGETNLSGSGSLALDGPRPKITAAFTSTMIDLAGLATQESAADETADAAAPARTSPYVFSPDPLPLGALRSVDADVTIEADNIQVTEKAVVTEAVIALALNDGDLNLTQLKGKAMQGTVDMTARLNAGVSPATLQTALTVTGLNYGDVLKTMDISEDVDGVIDIDVALSGRGNSMREIASTLNGHEEIVATDGIINNKLLALVSTGLGNIMGPLFGGQQETRLNCFINRFDITNGVANSRALVVDSDTFTVGGEGTVDLRDESLDLLFDIHTRDTALVSLAVPFRIKGTLADPSASPDPLATAKAAAGLARGVGDLLGGGGGDGGGGLLGRGEDALGGLLGGGGNPLGGLLGGGKKEEEPAPAADQTAAGDPQNACQHALQLIGR